MSDDDSVNMDDNRQPVMARREPYWDKTPFTGLHGRVPICGADVLQKTTNWFNRRLPNHWVSVVDLQNDPDRSWAGCYLVCSILGISVNSSGSSGVNYTSRMRGRNHQTQNATKHHRTLRLMCLKSAPGKNVFHILEGGGFAPHCWTLDITNRDNGTIRECE